MYNGLGWTYMCSQWGERNKPMTDMSGSGLSPVRTKDHTLWNRTCLIVLSPDICQHWRVATALYTLDGWPAPPEMSSLGDVYLMQACQTCAACGPNTRFMWPHCDLTCMELSVAALLHHGGRGVPAHWRTSSPYWLFNVQGRRARCVALRLLRSVSTH